MHAHQIIDVYSQNSFPYNEPLEATHPDRLSKLCEFADSFSIVQFSTMLTINVYILPTNNRDDVKESRKIQPF